MQANTPASVRAGERGRDESQGQRPEPRRSRPRGEGSVVPSFDLWHHYRDTATMYQ